MVNLKTWFPTTVGNSRNSRTPHWRGDAPCLPANGRLNIWPGILDNSSERADWDGISTLLVAGFNPVEKIFVKMGSSSPIFGGENKTYSICKAPPRFVNH